MITAKETNYNLRDFVKVVEKIQKIISINFIEVDFDENDGYLHAKDNFLFIVDLTDCDIFITYNKATLETMNVTALLEQFKSTKLKYTVDDYLKIKNYA